MSSAATARPTPERTAELVESLAEIRARVQAHAAPGTAPALVAVSKYKPAADILACYDAGQRDFGENYVQELVDKAAQLPDDIRWHFIGTLQSNKCRTLASIANIHTIQTVTSAKAASALDKALPPTRTAPLNVFLQVNTSGEAAKSGLPPPPAAADAADSELAALALHVVDACPRLRLQGLMTIGALAASLASTAAPNADFLALCAARDALQAVLPPGGAWGHDGRLLLSMGMSSDFEAALAAGSDVVRVGTGVFGQRHLKSGAQ